MGVRSYTMVGSTQSIAKEMIANNVSRAALYTDDEGVLKATHPFLNGVVDHLNDPVTGSDYDKHDAFFIEVHAATESLMGAALWRTVRGQGCGGIRLRTYTDFDDYINDGLR
jgi:hypothetical protein